MKRLFLLLSLAAGILLASCALPGQQPPDGYLQSDDAGVVYIHWTEVNGQLSGTWSSTTLQSGKTETHDLPFTGILNDSTGAISITVSLMVTSVESHGTLKDNVLNLDLQSNGTVKHKTLNGASTADYQAALSTFKAKHP